MQRSMHPVRIRRPRLTKRPGSGAVPPSPAGLCSRGVGRPLRHRSRARGEGKGPARARRQPGALALGANRTVIGVLPVRLDRRKRPADAHRSRRNGRGAALARGRHGNHEALTSASVRDTCGVSGDARRDTSPPETPRARRRALQDPSAGPFSPHRSPVSHLSRPSPSAPFPLAATLPRSSLSAVSGRSGGDEQRGLECLPRPQAIRLLAGTEAEDQPSLFG